MPEYCGFDINDLVRRIKAIRHKFFPKYSVDIQLTEKGEMVKTKTENTASIAEYARKQVYYYLGYK